MPATLPRHDEPRRWIEEIRGRGVPTVAAAFELEPGPSRSLRPCPACGWTDARGSGDRRGPVGMTPDGQGWRCHRCQAGGDAVTLAALVTTGSADPSGRWAEVRRACADLGLCDPDPRDDAPPPRVRKLPPPKPAAPVPPRRPPAAEVASLWAACRPVTEDPAVAAWIEKERALDPAAVEDRDLARALPLGIDLPRWARYRGASWAEGFRLIVPMFGPGGEVESLHGRALAPASSRDKAASPAGATVAGLAMADPLARLMLARAPTGDGKPAAETIQRVGLIVAEGVPDFLTWGVEWSDANEDAPAVLAVIAGSWTEDLAATVPDGARVIVRTHPDDAGAKYADRICATLAKRCDVRRRKGKT